MQALHFPCPFCKRTQQVSPVESVTQSVTESVTESVTVHVWLLRPLNSLQPLWPLWPLLPLLRTNFSLRQGRRTFEKVDEFKLKICRNFSSMKINEIVFKEVTLARCFLWELQIFRCLRPVHSHLHSWHFWICLRNIQIHLGYLGTSIEGSFFTNHVFLEFLEPCIPRFLGISGLEARLLVCQLFQSACLICLNVSYCFFLEARLAF